MLRTYSGRVKGEVTSPKLNQQVVFGIFLRMLIPDHTVEEKEAGAFLQLKAVIETGLLEEAKKALRKSLSLLKQDVYTVTQSKLASERPQQPKLYSDLFKKCTITVQQWVKDASSVSNCSENIVVSLNNILSTA